MYLIMIHEDTYIQAQCLRSDVAKKKSTFFFRKCSTFAVLEHRELFEKRERVLFLLACGTEEKKTNIATQSTGLLINGTNPLQFMYG